MESKELVSKAVFLTFDDGPNEPHTSWILDILKESEVKASFFVCGKNAEYYAGAAKRIVEDGHAIGNHTYSHSRVLTYVGLLAKEIEKTKEIIFQITGVRTVFFRPPWGWLTPWMLRYIQTHGYKLVLWDVAAGDWRRPAAAIIAQKVAEQVKPNSIILLHDGDQTRRHCDRSRTVAALPLIIEELKKEGYAFLSLEAPRA